jgi:hypothetical protein
MDEVVGDGVVAEERAILVKIYPQAIHRTIKNRTPPHQSQNIALKSEQTNEGDNVCNALKQKQNYKW